jgi:hypothetical protein
VEAYLAMLSRNDAPPPPLPAKTPRGGKKKKA